MPYYQRRPYNHGRSRKPGNETALEHIEEARRLSALLGGTDETVKRYLFSLSSTARGKSELGRVLEEYGQKHGRVAQEYAELTLPHWQAGHVIMSGMVAERLYNLLPPRMPISTKYEMAEELWRHVGPSSSKVLRFGSNASHAEIVRLIDEHISEVVHDYKIPDTLEKRFNWLADNDVAVKQQLLNHLRNLDKRLVIEAGGLQVASMLNHLSNEQPNFTQMYTHTVIVGKHKLKLVADKNMIGCVLLDDFPLIANSTSFAREWVPSLIWLLVGATAVVLAIVFNN
jgi:hypothetical protein